MLVCMRSTSRSPRCKTPDALLHGNWKRPVHRCGVVLFLFPHIPSASVLFLPWQICSTIPLKRRNIFSNTVVHMNPFFQLFIAVAGSAASVQSSEFFCTQEQSNRWVASSSLENWNRYQVAGAKSSKLPVWQETKNDKRHTDARCRGLLYTPSVVRRDDLRAN